MTTTDQPVSSGHLPHLAPIIPHLVFGLLLALETYRLFRHVMWRDELQAWMIAAASRTPIDLLINIKHGCEGHPALWHFILWLTTRLTSDPVWMQAVQLLIGAGIWLLIWRFSPFSVVEKLLLLFSYCVFWEYFVVSRSYGLGVLLAFAYISLRAGTPDRKVLPWVILGLLANTSVFGAIWALGLAPILALESRRAMRALLAGGAIFLALLALAVWTMAPPHHCVSENWGNAKLLGWNARRSLAFIVDGFAPFQRPWLADSLAWIGGPFRSVAAAWQDVDPIQSMLGVLRNYRPILPMLAFAAPLAALWLIIRDRARMAEFALTFCGILVFVQLYRYGGAARHHATLFAAFVGAVWLARAAAGGARRGSRLFLALLAVNAVAGIMSLTSELRPFSHSRDVAAWLRDNDVALLMGTRATTTSPIAGYLARPIYYLECECEGSYMTGRMRRKADFTADEIAERVARAMQSRGVTEAVLVRSFPRLKQKKKEAPPPQQPLEQQTKQPDIAFVPVATFTGAVIANENYAIYRVTRGESPPEP